MPTSLLKHLSDNDSKESLAIQLRRARIAAFRSYLCAQSAPIKILDVGGTETYWEQMKLADRPNLQFTLLNVTQFPTRGSNFHSIQGDARGMRQFADNEFDFVFSNSVIEHVGDFTQQRLAADEMRRVAPRYIVQTPNYWFPIEPHFLVPGFQFLPMGLRIALVRRFSLGWVQREPERSKAEQTVKSVNLLTKSRLSQLFPEARIESEWFWGLPKSFIAVHWPDA